MMRFCPLCIKSGLKKKIKAFQINFEEAVWSCEMENCPWPIGYEEILSFQRNAFTCNWNEELFPPIGISEESVSLLLYTPPVTPGEEFSKESTENISTECSLNPSLENKLDKTLLKNKIIYSKEPIGFLSTLELSELESNNFIKESKNSTKEENANVNICKTLPKITNIQKTNLDVTVLSKSDECCDNEKMTNITKNILFNNTLCKEADLDSLQYKTKKEQIKNNKVQLDDQMNGAKTNTEILETDKLLFDSNNINNLNTTNDFSLNISDISLNIDKILEDILNTENHITENINNDWLHSLIDM